MAGPAGVGRQALANRAADAIERWLQASGVHDAEYYWEPVPGTSLIRLWVVAGGFAPISYMERQTLVWRAMKANLSMADATRIGLVFTVTQPESGQFES